MIICLSQQSNTKFVGLPTIAEEIPDLRNSADKILQGGCYLTSNTCAATPVRRTLPTMDSLDEDDDEYVLNPNDGIFEMLPTPISCMDSSNASLVLLISPSTRSRGHCGNLSQSMRSRGHSDALGGYDGYVGGASSDLMLRATASVLKTMDGMMSLAGGGAGSLGEDSGRTRAGGGSMPRFSFSSRINLGRMRKVRRANRRERKATKTLAIVLGIILLLGVIVLGISNELYFMNCVGLYNVHPALYLYYVLIIYCTFTLVKIQLQIMCSTKAHTHIYFQFIIQFV